MTQTKRSPVIYLHYAIVLFLCFVFPNLPPIGALTPSGMALVGPFLGAVWGWSMIDMLWPSFAGILAMGWFLGFDKVAAAGFGNTTVVMLMFMFVVMTCVTETGAVDWLLKKLLSFKFFVGKPWVTIGFFFYVSYLLAGLNSVIMAVILISVFRTLFKTLNIEPYTKLPTLFLIGVMYCLLMGQVTFPFMGVSFTLLAAYSAMFQTSIDFAGYLAFTLPLSVLMILIFLLLMRFVFRVDVTPFKNVTPEALGECPPINSDQKKAFVVLGGFILSLLGSSIAYLGPLYLLMQKLTVMGIAVVALFLTLPIKRKDGKGFVNVKLPMQWDIILITVLVMILSAYMNNPEFGVTATITMLVQPLLAMSPYVFIILVLAIAIVLTHFATNMVLCIVLMPFMVTFAGTIGMTPTGIVALLFFSCQMSLATPGGGAPISAMFYGINDWVKTGMMSKYALILIPFLFVGDIVFGLSWASILF